MELNRKESLLEREILFLVKSYNYNSCLCQYQKKERKKERQGNVGTKI